MLTSCVCFLLYMQDIPRGSQSHHCARAFVFFAHLSAAEFPSQRFMHVVIGGDRSLMRSVHARARDVHLRLRRGVF